MITRIAFSIVSGTLGYLTGWGVAAAVANQTPHADVLKTIPAIRVKLPTVQPIDHDKNITQLNGDLQEIKNEIMAAKADLRQDR